MVSLEEQEKIVFLNSQYEDNKELITRLQTKLLEETSTLDLSIKDLKDTQNYLQDKVNIFRFLRESNFNLDKAHEELLKTIAWRVELQITDLTYKDCIDFFQPNGFAFFHKLDKTGRPLLFVRLRYFPKTFQDSSKRLIDHIRTFACLILEMSRRLTWDMTCDTNQLVSQLTVVVNIEKAPIIPVDAEIIKMIGLLLESRFPGMVGSVNILNFGWMYQGVWTLVKYLISDEAKESIQFTTVTKLNPLISSDSILKEMGGDDDYEWTLNSDIILEKYGKMKELPFTPPLSEEEEEDVVVSRPHSISEDSNSSSSDDIFFDANDSLSIIPSSPSTPIQLPPLQQQNNIPTPPLLVNSTSTITPPGSPTYGNLSTWVGLRMGVDFLTSFIDTKGKGEKKITETIKDIHQKHDLILPTPHDEDVIVVNSAPPANTVPPSIEQEAIASTTPVIYRLQRAQLYIKRFTHRILRLSFGQHGMVCWVLLYFFLRIPVESIVQKSLVRTSWIEPKRIKSTTIGITAAVSAIVSSTISNVIEQSYK